jgi:hypothetical protein
MARTCSFMYSSSFHAANSADVIGLNIESVENIELLITSEIAVTIGLVGRGLAFLRDDNQAVEAQCT